MPDAHIIELDLTDSTNNYAMQLIDGNKAHPGLTIVANQQTAGKGQRGRTWVDTPGQSLLMSMIVVPKHSLGDQFIFNIAVATAIVNELQQLDEHWKVQVKWPNDIIINDKKAGGILIENVLRGSNWSYSVVGLGLNILQPSFPYDLPHATSLKIASGREFDKRTILNTLREAIFYATGFPKDAATLLRDYNALLFRRGQQQVLTENEQPITTTILHANADGTLAVQLEDGSIKNYVHGQAVWAY